MDMDALGPEDVNERVLELFKAMRKDSCEKTEMKGWELNYLVPIGKPTPVTNIHEEEQ